MALSATTAVSQPRFSEAAGCLQTINEKMWPQGATRSRTATSRGREISEPGGCVILCVKPIDVSARHNNSLLPGSVHIFKCSHNNRILVFANVANIVFPSAMD